MRSICTIYGQCFGLGSSIHLTSGGAKQGRNSGPSMAANAPGEMRLKVRTMMTLRALSVSSYLLLAFRKKTDRKK